MGRVHLILDIKTRVYGTADEIWPNLRPTLFKLLRGQPVKTSEWQHLFFLVSMSYDEVAALQVYTTFYDVFMQFLNSECRSPLKGGLTRKEFFEWFLTGQKDFLHYSTYLHLPFKNLEKYISQIYEFPANSKTAEESIIATLVFENWLDIVFPKVLNKIMEITMFTLKIKRDGKRADDGDDISRVLSTTGDVSHAYSHSRLSMFQELFMNAYLRDFEGLYKQEAPKYLQQNGLGRYVRYMDKLLKQEEAFVVKYLGQSSKHMKACKKRVLQMLMPSTEQLAAHLCSKTRGRKEQFQFLFNFLDKTPFGTAPIFEAIEWNFTKRGLSEISQLYNSRSRSPKECIERLTTIFRNISEDMKDIIRDDSRILQVRNKVCERLMHDIFVFEEEHHQENRYSQLLVDYCNTLITKTNDNQKDWHIKLKKDMEDVLLILSHMQDKVAFLESYKSLLTQRLIVNAKLNCTMEFIMLSILSDEIPKDEILNLDRMVLDLNISWFFNYTHAIIRHFGENIPVVIAVKFLRARNWVAEWTNVQISLPLALRDYTYNVELYYRSVYPHRKLQWNPHLSTAIVCFNNDVGSYDLTVTNYQMSVLFVWEEEENAKVSFDRLRWATGIPDGELKRTLWSLVAFPELERQPLLSEPDIKSPNDINDHTLFWVNEDFAVVKGSVPVKEGSVCLIPRSQDPHDPDQDEEAERIVRLRSLETRKAVIRAMRAERRVNGTELQRRVVTILKTVFLPPRRMIEEQIQWLIAQGTVQIDKSDANVYVYSDARPLGVKFTSLSRTLLYLAVPTLLCVLYIIFTHVLEQTHTS